MAGNDLIRVGDSIESSDLLGELAGQLANGKVEADHLSEFIAKAVPYCLQHGKFGEFFRFWERHGFHVTPVHFYQPIPDTRTLRDSLWNRPSKLVGIDMNDDTLSR